MIRDIEEVLSQSTHMVAEAPTGFGKTITSLYPTVKYAIAHDKKILYLVRTNSQEQKVIEECKSLGVSAVALQGRRNMCPLTNEREGMRGGNAEEISMLCSKLKKDVENGNTNACPYFANFLNDPEQLFNFIKEGHTAEEVYAKGIETEICPYETTKSAMKFATVVVAPYIYFLLPFMRNMLLDRMQCELHDLILIVDEAHNLPDFAREIVSDELSEESIERMETECLKYGNRVIRDVPCADVAEFLRETIYRLEKYVSDDEGLVPQYALEEELSELMHCGLNDIQKMAMEMVRYGMEIREMKMRKRELPRSYIYHAGNFLMYWKDTYSSDFIHLARLGENPKLEIFSLDPAHITDIIRNVHSSIHMSGTLILENYRATINLPESTKLVRYPSPFPPENLKIIYATDVTTRYAELQDNIEKLREYIENIISLHRNTVVFFPSYALMHRILEDMHISVDIESRKMAQDSLASMLQKFRMKGGTLFSVFGGRISEGLDFPGKQLEIVVIVGIPFPRPTPKVKMLEKYYDYKFGHGWDFAFREPALIKMRQAIGRLIRTENDRGIAVILDRRAAQFTEEIKMNPSKNICAEIQTFFNEEKGEEGRHRDR